MHSLRRRDKALTDEKELRTILATTAHVTVAMCHDDEPYLATLSHGYDEAKHCIYFHCAKTGKKIEILGHNPVVWGQAFIDGGYKTGHCDHLYTTVQFRGTVSFIDDEAEKRHALTVMIEQLEEDPAAVAAAQVTAASVRRVHIGRIDIDFLSGKRAATVIVSV